MTASLQSVRSDQPLTLREAIAWAWPAPTDGGVIGFAYALDSAPWWRLVDGVPFGPDGPCALDTAYELVAFDGDLELRWLQTGLGRGHAVVLAEQGLRPPAGIMLSNGQDAEGAPVGAPPRALGARRHWLADHVAPLPGGWTRLQAARYRTVAVPIALPTDDVPWKDRAVALRSVEYTVEDQHGNLSVVETRLSGLEFVLRTSEPSEPARRAG